MDLKDLELRSNLPYPEIVDAKDDPRTVSVIRSQATSRFSELSAVLQYIYQSVVSNNVMEDVASIFEEIAIVEMMHLDMLMHAITSFGGVPKYEDTQGNAYNTNCINYSMKLKDMLDLNIKAENIAIANYKEAINHVNNESLKKLFARIILDEECHIKVFKYIKDNVQFLSI